jgi:hypothetical protein
VQRAIVDIKERRVQSVVAAEVEQLRSDATTKSTKKDDALEHGCFHGRLCASLDTPNPNVRSGLKRTTVHMEQQLYDQKKKAQHETKWDRKEWRSEISASKCISITQFTFCSLFEYSLKL